MDRARQAGTHRHHHRRPAARLIAAAALALASPACRNFTIDPDRVIAIEVPTAPTTVLEGDTVRLSARLLNALGAVVAGAKVTWATDDSITGFTLDSAGGLVRGITAGTWKRVFARYETLQSDPLTLTVTIPPGPAPLRDR